MRECFLVLVVLLYAFFIRTFNAASSTTLVILVLLLDLGMSSEFITNTSAGIYELYGYEYISNNILTVLITTWYITNLLENYHMDIFLILLVLMFMVPYIMFICTYIL